MQPISSVGVSAATPVTATPPAAPQPRLVHAAHEFEAQMMKEMLKPLTSSGSSLTGSDDESDGGSNGALGAFASEALGRSLSEHGGFGIAKSILGDLSGNHSVTAPVTPKRNLETGIRATE